MSRVDSTTNTHGHLAPFLTHAAALHEVPSGPAETFVLACIDGANTAADIAQTTGLALEEVTRIIELLVSRGVVAFAEALSGGQAAPRSSAANQSGEYPLVGLNVPHEPVAMSAEQQQHLADLDRRLASLDHYELLGVEPSAEPKLMRSAYYELVRTLHPDRYFGKQLGGFESKLLRVFAKITEAYYMLRRPESRAEYDRYLAAKRRTHAFDRQFFDATQQEAEVAEALRRIADAAAAEARNTPVSSVRPVSSTAPVSVSGPVRRPSSAFSLDPEARKRALARKLGHSSLPPARSPSSPVIPASRSAEDLKQRYDQRLARAREEQRQHYVTLASEAAERKDLIAACNALRVACSLAPDDLELRGDLVEMERRAASELWEAYAEPNVLNAPRSAVPRRRSSNAPPFTP